MAPDTNCHNFSYFITSRLVAQEAEYARQQDVVQKTHQHITGTLGAKVQKQVDRLDAQIARQSALMARADGLLQKVMETREPALSPAEKEWMSDVKKMEKVVKALDERRHQVGTQYEVLKRRLAEMKRQLASGQSISEDSQKHKRVSYSLLDRSGSPDFTQSWSPRRSSTVVAKRQPVKRYGEAQIKPIESALTDQ
jgi:hypothetical protein